MTNLNLKIAGLLAVAVVVVGATVLIAQISPKGVSADIEDIAAGEVVLIAKDDYEMTLEKLENYFTATDKTTQDNIISDVVKMLQDAQK